MSLVTRHSSLLFLLVAALSTAGADDKERLVFQPGAKTPDLPAPAKPKTPGSPAEKIDLFFLAMKAGQIEAAYDALVKGSLIATRPEDVTALKEQSTAAIDRFGPIAGYEVVNELAVGSHLLRRTAISLNTDLPLRWRFYFYRSRGVWRLVDLRVDDALVELFEEPGQRSP